MEPFEEGNRNGQKLLSLYREGQPVRVTIILEEFEDEVNGRYFNVEWNPMLPIFTFGETVEEAESNAMEAFDLFFEDEIQDFSLKVHFQTKRVKGIIA